MVAEYCYKRVCLSLCLPVCLSSSIACISYLRNYMPDLHHCFLCVAVARSSSGGVAIRYVLPVYE